jgi:glycosyltransferase involved in cell wall biosynthesis
VSTDDTLDVVRRTGGCRIIQREFIDYASFKNWAIPQASHPWVLLVDADERLTPELAAEIRGTVDRDDPSRDAYGVRAKIFFLGRPIRHSGWNHHAAIRLFRRDACRYGAARVHEQLEVQPGKVGTLRARLLHYTCRSLAQWTEKQNRYTTLWAEDKHAAGRRTSRLGILIRPVVSFFRAYFFRAGFLDGTAGLICCLSGTFYTFLKYAKLWHLNHDVQR